MNIFKKKKAEIPEIGPTARLQAGNYIIKEWGRSAAPAGEVYNVPCITVEDAALTWRVTVGAEHARYSLLQTFLHWAEVSPDGSETPPDDAMRMLESVCAVTFFMVTEDFMGVGAPDVKFLKDVLKAMKGYADRKAKAAREAQTDAEREKADAEALEDVK